MRRRSKDGPYERLSDAQKTVVVREGAARFLVNLSDYLDTGLFLDQRRVRRLLGSLAKGRSFLNLFSYTGSASVHAALGGARTTVSVDLSRRYGEWAKENFALNGLSLRTNARVEADCVQWLDRERSQYDLIFLSPPTRSSSRRMKQSFSILEDAELLLESVLRRLAPGGVLVFSVPIRDYALAGDRLGAVRIKDVTKQTLAPDFIRSRTAPRTWLLTRA